ncbi:MAG: hypothetical protein Tsb009_18310 [Planctomycetaceae bacterium]
MSDSNDFFEHWQDNENDETPTVTCSNCGADVYEDADSCPRCGEFLVAAHSPLAGKPAWFVAIGIVGILAVLILLSGVLQWI